MTLQNPPPSPPVPQPVIPLEYATSGGESPRRKLVRWLGGANWIFCAVAWILIVVHVESVLATGPVVFAFGVALMISSRRVSFWSMIIGLCNVCVCLLFIAFVNLWGWGPDKAHLPFSIMGLVYIGALAVLTVHSNRSSAAYLSNDGGMATDPSR